MAGHALAPDLHVCHPGLGVVRSVAVLSARKAGQSHRALWVSAAFVDVPSQNGSPGVGRISIRAGLMSLPTSA